MEVLKELMGHEKMDTTSGYYRITTERKRNAIKRVLPLQMTATGAHLRLIDAVSASDTGRYALSQIAVPMGSCVEPSNVRAPAPPASFATSASAAPISGPTPPTCPSCAPI